MKLLVHRFLPILWPAKRLIALLLSLILVVGMLPPTPVFAAGEMPAGQAEVLPPPSEQESEPESEPEPEPEPESESEPEPESESESNEDIRPPAQMPEA